MNFDLESKGVSAIPKKTTPQPAIIEGQYCNKKCQVPDKKGIAE